MFNGVRHKDEAGLSPSYQSLSGGDIARGCDRGGNWWSSLNYCWDGLALTGAAPVAMPLP